MHAYREIILRQNNIVRRLLKRLDSGKDLTFDDREMINESLRYVEEIESALQNKIVVDDAANENLNVHKPGRVAMRMAYEWTCEECGRDNFERAMVPEFADHRTRRDAAIALGVIKDWEADEAIPEDFEFGLTTYPHRVQCGHCWYRFDTENFDATMDGQE